MIASKLLISETPIPRNQIPGPGMIIGGDGLAGFYGEVPATEFITGDALASHIGLTAGSSTNSGSGWLKFSLDNKILYVAKQPLRHSLSWDAIYQRGAVYGVAGNGQFPTGVPRPQTTSVTINGSTFRVRLLRGSTLDPYTGAQNVSDPWQSAGSEWTQLMSNVCNVGVHSQPGPKWAHYTEEQLGIAQGAGGYTWCQESNQKFYYHRVVCGYWLISWVSTTQSDDGSVYCGWRPCLELIP